MRHGLNLHHRRSIRLKGYDYSQAGAYFVTICIQHKALLLEPSPAHQMINSWWQRIPGKFPNIDLDEFAIMPNHIHGVIIITNPVGADLCVRPDPSVHPDPCVRPEPWAGADQGQTRGAAPTRLGAVVQWFKTMTTNAYIHGVKNDGWQPFPGKLWQRNYYYEHIIRSERALQAIRTYIRENPLHWHLDTDNPCLKQGDLQTDGLWDILKLSDNSGSQPV